MISLYFRAQNDALESTNSNLSTVTEKVNGSKVILAEGTHKYTSTSGYDVLNIVGQRGGQYVDDYVVLHDSSGQIVHKGNYTGITAASFTNASVRLTVPSSTVGFLTGRGIVSVD